MLGFGYIGQTITNNYFGSGTRQITMNSIHCSGTEENIAECEHRGWQITSQYNYDSVAISCLRDGAVALFGGESSREGRLEVYHNGTWGTVCDDGFTDIAAKVVCYSLGFGGFRREVNISLYGIGRGQIWLDDIRCSGSERHVSECSHRGWGVHDCGNSEDVAVSCAGDPTPAILSSTSTVSASNRDVPGIGLILIIIVVIVVLLLIVSVIIVLRMELYIRRNPRQERTEVAMVPMPATTTNDYNYRAFNTAASSIHASNDNVDMNVRHPSAVLLDMILLNCRPIMVDIDTMWKINNNTDTYFKLVSDSALILFWTEHEVQVTETLSIIKNNKKIQLSLTNPRDAKACQNCSNSTSYNVVADDIGLSSAFNCYCVRNPRNPEKFTENSNLWSSRSPRSSILVSIESPYVTGY